jgi:hypothetical protein
MVRRACDATIFSGYIGARVAAAPIVIQTDRPRRPRQAAAMTARGAGGSGGAGGAGAGTAAARREMLRRVVAAADPQGLLRLVETVEERGEDLFAAIAEPGLEGIPAKRAAAPYRGGRSADWLEVRREPPVERP